MLNITVPTGIGDISWVLQRIYPWYLQNKTEIRIVIPDEQPQRSKPFIDLIPWISGCDYTSAIRTREILRAPEPKEIPKSGDIIIQINTHLESGKHLRDFMPFIPYIENYNFGFEPVFYPKRQILVFPASEKAEQSYGSFGGWSREKWAMLCNKLIEKYPRHELILIGAEWDRSMINAIENLIKGNHSDLIGSPLDEALRLIRDSAYFYSFPSGLGVLADLLNTPTNMFMSSHLKKMVGTWGRKASVESNRYRVELFPIVDEAVRNSGVFI